MSTPWKLLIAVASLAAMVLPLGAGASPPAGQPGSPELLATLPGGSGSGSAIGPGGALYVPQPATGEIWRVDPGVVRGRSMRAACPGDSNSFHSAA